MEFRDLKRQYQHIKEQVDANIRRVIESSSFIGGEEVNFLEKTLAGYVGVKHCISCANGTDALQLALMAWGVGEGDAVFVPDFTFFSSGEVVSAVGATPVFVDVRPDTFNIDVPALEEQIRTVEAGGKWKPKAVIAVDLFGQPAEYEKIRLVTDRCHLLLLEDGAQGFGGRIGDQKACSFGDISTTSFFPAKPLGCYGDGGAIFTDHDEWAELIRSLKVHGKGSDKYDNVRIGMNSRLDSVQAAVLNAKFSVFIGEELDREQEIAERYTENLKDTVKTPIVAPGYTSSWAQYTIKHESKDKRDGLQTFLKEAGIPSMVYYKKAMHRQDAFDNGYIYDDGLYQTTNRLCDTVLSLPFHPYMEDAEIDMVCNSVKEYLES